jgi:hypothetical protein
MVSIKLRTSEYWSKVIKKSEFLDFAGSFASKQRCFTRNDTGEGFSNAERKRCSTSLPASGTVRALHVWNQLFMVTTSAP